MHLYVLFLLRFFRALSYIQFCSKQIEIVTIDPKVKFYTPLLSVNLLSFNNRNPY